MTCWYLPESPIYLLRRGQLDELREALMLIADWNGTVLDWDSIGFIDEDEKRRKNSPHRRRPDKAENVMRVSGLPTGTKENAIRKWLASNLPSDMVGLVYHCAFQASGEVCYVSFITHKLMRDARSRLNKTRF